MTCRNEVLAAASELARISPDGEFTVSDVVQHLQRHGSQYAESTIRTHITSRMCANAPDHHGTVYDDLVRTEHGSYRLADPVSHQVMRSKRPSPAKQSSSTTRKQPRRASTDTGVTLSTTQNFQREGSVSNAHVGRHFEQIALQCLGEAGIEVRVDFPLEVGVGGTKKVHRFDLGQDSPPTIVECKSHRWTSGNNVPSAKMTVWNEAMYYFSCAPSTFRKIFFVLKDVRTSNGETLAHYYARTFSHLIPEDVEIWEYDGDASLVEIVVDSN